LPVRFEAGRGQGAPDAQFVARTADSAVVLGPTEAQLMFWGPRHATLPQTVRLSFPGADRRMQIEARNQLPGTTHYFLGADPRGWQPEVLAYGQVTYRGLYPGVDLVFHGRHDELEYDLVVAPGSDPRAIRLRLDAPVAPRLDAAGDIVVALDGGEVRHRRPVAYQEIGGRRRPVAVRQVLQDHRIVSFEVGRYDRRHALIIDPVVTYSTYLGGGDSDEGFGIAVDGAGNAYVTGRTYSATSFPTQNALQSLNAGSMDVFVTKLDAGGQLVYSTYLGGNDADEGFDIAVDGAGNAYVTGRTYSANSFPTRNALQSLNAGSYDAFVTKLDASGQLIYSTYLGGGDSDEGFGIAVDGAGNTYVTGRTYSATSFPTRSAFQSLNAGSYDAFVTKLDASGQLVYSTYLGGNDADEAYDIAVDSGGRAWATGRTYSATSFPTRDPIQALNAGSYDAFVTKIETSGQLAYSTYFGGDDDDEACGIAVDGSGNAHVAGRTYSATSFPTLNAFQSLNAGSYDAFATKFTYAGQLVYSTYLGGGDSDEGFGIAVDTAANTYVTGRTYSATSFPTRKAFQSLNAGSYDAFVTKLTVSGQPVYSTYLGGGDSDEGFGIAVDTSGNAYGTGRTYSATSFPTWNAFQSLNAGSYDAFVSKLAAAQPPPAAASLAKDVAASASTIPVDDVSQFPDTGEIQLDGERITYNGKRATTGMLALTLGAPVQPGELLNVQRGVAGTTPAAHQHGATVLLLTFACAGDCAGDGAVTIDELLAMVNIALGNGFPAVCVAGNSNGDEAITIDEILAAVNNALNGCVGG
jgi:hypothetical protein